MKKFTLIFALLMSASALVMAQPQLSWRFANPQVINAGTQLQFDVEVKAITAGTFHRDLQIYFDYNTTAFGSDIVLNGGISYIPLALMDDVVKYDVVNMADNTSSKFAIITEALNEMDEIGSSTHYIEVTDTYQGLIQFTIDIAPGANTETSGIAFDQVLMDGGQYYQSTTIVEPVKYADPSDYNNDLTSFILSSSYGSITYNNTANTPLTDCVLTLKQGATTIATATTDGTGAYSFSNISDGAYTIESDCLLPRGGTGLLDIVQTRQFMLGQITFSTLQQMAADVDAGGNVGLLDIVKMRQFMLGQIAGWAQSDFVFEIQSVNVSSGLGTIDYQGLCSGDPDRSYTP